MKLGPGAISPSSSARGLFATLEQPRRFHPIRPCREGRRRTAPAQRIGIVEERRIGAQGREILEEQSKLALFTENVRREIFNPTVAVQKLDRGVDATEQGLAEEEALKKGMEEKSREFTEKGSEL